jgi:DNA-binding CsgD family transcriptional regulator
VRLADLLAGLSRLADLGFGLQAGEALRLCALATRLARSLDLPDDDVRAAFYTALLHHVGCTGYAHETARLFGDELVLNMAAGQSNSADPRDLFTTFLPTLTRGRPPLERARLALTAVTRGDRFARAYTVAACEVGRDAARRLRLPEAVQRSVYHVYEEWRGGGAPAGLAGDDLPVGSRVARLTGIAVLFDTAGGVGLAVEAVRRRSGGMLDPELAARFIERAEALLGEVAAADPRALVLEAEPRPVVPVPEDRLVEVAATFADLADLKSPFTHGHSAGVAALARGAGERLLAGARQGGLDPEAVGAVLAAAGQVPLVARQPLPAGLSPREVEVLALVAEGCGNAEIARRLVISRRTAEDHVQHIYTKIGVSSRAAAALFAMEHNLLARRDR